MDLTETAEAPVTESNPAGQAPRIQVRNVTKRFKRRGGGGEVIPLDNVSLDLGADEMVVLLGPSGCGKTTLLRCVAGLERPDAGEIVVNGETVFSAERGIFVPPNKRNVGMMFQSYALWPHMSVYQNVVYPLQTRKVPSAQARERVMGILEAVGLSELADQYPGQISGGQQQRVALARSLVANQKVILFDEPLSNVDAKVRQQLRVELLRIQRQFGFSALYVTHDQAEAMELGDRIAVLDQGRVAQIDPPHVVYDRPASRYVSNFIGTANTWDGTVTAVGDGLVTVHTPVGELQVEAAGQVVSPEVGESVGLMFRPERGHIHTETPSGANALRCLVDTRLFVGSHTEYVLHVDGSVPIRVWSSATTTLREGEQYWVQIPPEAFRLLPADK